MHVQGPAYGSVGEFYVCYVQEGIAFVISFLLTHVRCSASNAELQAVR